MTELVWQNLTKFEFLRRNDAELKRYLGQVLEITRDRYGTDAEPVSAQDVWVITNCEGGIAGGHVDPQFVHSRGEVGLFPLPENIVFWNGADAPAWNQPMTIETNVHNYFLYMGHLKNRAVKTIDGLKLYGALFRGRTGGLAAETNAKVLAGVIHGYFFEGNYTDNIVPLQRLLTGYKDDTSIADMLLGTRYVLAGSPILVNRDRNIRDALDELARG